MRSSRHALLRVLAVAAATSIATSAHASFHLMQIEQVIGGVNGDVTAQAIQLRERSTGENFVNQGRLVVRDAAGLNPIVLMDVNAPVFGDAAGNRILIASPNMVNYLTTAPDFMMTNLIPASYMTAGSLTWEQDAPATIYWRVSWGGASYTGSGSTSTLNDANGVSTPAFNGPLPSTTLQALQFKFTAGTLSLTSANDYQVTAAAATFVNNELVTGAVTAGIGSCSAPYGVDLYTTPSGTASINFSGNPIFDGFFGPGSDAFGGTITFQGVPIDATQSGPLGPTDTIVRRNATASMGPGGSGIVSLEMVAMSLQSIAPITVTYGGGGSPEQWDAKLVLSSTARQPRGTMTIMQNGCSCAEGGTFTGSLPVLPRIIFTRTLPTVATADFDYPSVGYPAITFTSSGTWQPANPGLPLATLSAPILIDQDAEPGTLDVSTGVRSSAFFPGFRAARCESTGCVSSPTTILRDTRLSNAFAADLLAPAEIGATDADGDGTPDDADNCATANPMQIDTDNDGIGDGCDNCPTARNFCQEDTDHDNVGDACQTVSVGPVGLDARIALGRLAPNPVVSALAFAVTVPEDMHVTVSVFDVRGRMVARIVDQTLGAGEHHLAWNTQRAALRTGSYFLRLEAGGITQTRKFSVLH